MRLEALRARCRKSGADIGNAGAGMAREIVVGSIDKGTDRGLGAHQNLPGGVARRRSGKKKGRSASFTGSMSFTYCNSRSA